MRDWREEDAMTYLPHPMHYTIEEFAFFVEKVTWKKWVPKSITLHNTGVPSLKQWLAWGTIPQERWGSALNSYYRKLGWHSAPHLVFCPHYVWNLCDLREDGVSVSCWNHETLGVEMVGDFRDGGDEWESGEGKMVQDNAIKGLRLLFRHLGLNPRTALRFHHECVADHHACPGNRVSKADVINRILGS